VHPRLKAVADELRHATERVDRLARGAPDDLWGARPAEDRWSAAECIEHLNLTSAAFFPILEKGLAEAGAAGSRAPGRYRRGLVGWLLWKSVAPGSRFRVRTGDAFVPSGLRAPEEVRRTFRDDQETLVRMVEAAAGLDLGSVRVASAFDPRVRYNLYACFTILARHQHRHLAQAEAAVSAARSSPA
jgi:hypothetical protein